MSLLNLGTIGYLTVVSLLVMCLWHLEITNMNRQLLKYSFPDTLSRVLDEYRVTKYKLAQISKLDPAHVSRLVRGLRTRPTGKTMQKLMLGLARLGVSDSDISSVQSSAGFGGFDDAAENATAVKAPSRSERPDRPRATALDPATITFDVADTSPPPTATGPSKAPVVLPEKLNMRDLRKFGSTLGPPRWVSLQLPDLDES
jgi:hypothetical protein